MMKQTLFIFLTMLALLSWPVHGVFAQDLNGHAHEEKHEQHDETEGHSHDDGHEHNDHGEATDAHDEHGHDDHKTGDAHDNHGHGHDDEHSAHEEGKTEIAPDAAKNAGVATEQVAPATIGNVISLTGRIVIDRNAKANVRARFPGIVRKVKVNLGETVEKGQILAVIESNESLKDYNVTAPISGVILERNTNLGDVANGEPLFTIADLSNVWAKFHVFPKDADMVKSGQSVRVHTLDERKSGTATIDMLFPTADALSQTLIAIVPLSNEQGREVMKWRPGMTIEGDVTLSEKQVPLAVRASALQTMENQTVVFVRDGDMYEPVPVHTGMSGAEYVEITNGLKAGQDYVSEGSFIIKADIMKAGAEHHH